jgi:hypothetical protein
MRDLLAISLASNKSNLTKKQLNLNKNHTKTSLQNIIHFFKEKL